MLGKTDEAIRLLKEIVDGTKSGWFMQRSLQARHEIVEILTDKFRTTGDAQIKADIYNEIQHLMLEDAVAQIDDFKPYESETAIPLYLMAKKVDSPQKAQDILQRIFSAHVAALKDNDGSNDSKAFRLLAKTLACVPGFELEAQISISLQYSVVDRVIFISTILRGFEDDGHGDEGDDDEGDAGHNDEGDAELDDEGDAELGDKGDAEHDERDEDVHTDCDIGCDGCSKPFPNWKSGPLYYCIIRMNTDLCEDDYQKRLALNRGEEVPDMWQTFCGPNHRYIRGPIAGWKGVERGVIRYGETSVPFKTWLADVEKKWDEKWKEFWEGDEGLRDVF